MADWDDFDRESRTFVSRASARRARDLLRDLGHKAVVETSGGKEHRVRVLHPEHKDLVSYFHPDEDPVWVKGNFAFRK